MSQRQGRKVNPNCDLFHSVPPIVHPCSMGLSLWGDHNRRWRGRGRQKKREITAGSNKKTPNAILHLQSFGQFRLLAKRGLKHRIVSSGSLFLITVSQCSVGPLNLAMSSVMSLGPPLICVCKTEMHFHPMWQTGNLRPRVVKCLAWDHTASNKKNED